MFVMHESVMAGSKTLCEVAIIIVVSFLPVNIENTLINFIF